MKKKKMCIPGLAGAGADLAGAAGVFPPSNLFKRPSKEMTNFCKPSMTP